MKKDKSNIPLYLFHEGTNAKTYEYLGSHPCDGGAVFRVWAPSADGVFLAGDFNGWELTHPLSRATEGGVWEIKVP